MFARKQKFENVTIFLDGSSFIECTFENCNLIYSGLLPAALNTNSFNNCRWEFSGAAQNTVGFMADLYRAGALRHSIIFEANLIPLLLSPNTECAAAF